MTRRPAPENLASTPSHKAPAAAPARSVLSAALALAALAGLFLLRRLGCLVGEREQMASSEAALLSQVLGRVREWHSGALP